MKLLNPSAFTMDVRYNAVLRVLHWLVLFLVLAAIVTIEFQDVFPKGSAGRVFMRSSHYVAGFLVLVLMTMRLCARLVLPAPPPVTGANWMQLSAKFAHVALYGLMLAMPILGITSVMLGGKPIDIYGLVITSPFEMNRALSRSLKNIHEIGATFVYILVGVHAAAALWHQFILKDHIFKRIL